MYLYHARSRPPAESPRAALSRPPGARAAALVLGCMLAASVLQAAESEPQGGPLHPVGVIGPPQGSGAFPGVAESAPSLRTHTLYRPAAAPPQPLPLLLWGNGACRDNGLQHSAFLREVASHGFFVIALGHARFEREAEGANEPQRGNVESPPPARGPDETDVSQMADAIDWADAQQRDAESPFHGWIDTSLVAVMGHSCGGLQAIRMAADPRVATSMTFNSGVLNRGPDTGASGIAVTKDELDRVRGPIAYISGGPDDIAHENAADDVERIDHVPVFFAYNDVGHGGTFWSQPDGGEYAEIAVAWLQWQLTGDERAGSMFTGTRCGLCGRDGWTVQRRVGE